MAICQTDQITTWCEGSAGLAHFIKYFLAEDRFESQPLRSADDNLILVTDAMLDNRDELAAALDWRADEASIRPDSAFVLAAYERWGKGCTAYLEGKFALAVWHRRERSLFCAVDHLGHHPLYYWSRHGELVFASTLKGLFALPRISQQLNDDAIAAHLARIDPPDPTATLYRDVKRLPAGHHMTSDADGTRIVRHWNPDARRVLRLPSDADYLKAFETELERAVRTSLQRGPRNVGVMVSGGLDSAAVTAVAGKILAEQGRRLQAFHLVPIGENRTEGPLRELDESRFVEALQQHAPHIDFHFIPHDITPLGPRTWDAYFDDNRTPFLHLPGSNNQTLAGLLDKLDIGVLLNGTGGNYVVSLECFPSGYLTHLFITGQWRDWLRESRGHRNIYGQSMRQLFRQTVLGPVKRFFLPAAAPHKTHPIFLLNQAFRKSIEIEARLQSVHKSWDAPAWNLRNILHRVLTEIAVQQTGAARSAVQRQPPERIGASPLLDRRFNEFCLSLPFNQQIRKGWDRRLLRESMRTLLPDNLRLRITRGFPQPAFHRLFKQSKTMLREELERIGSSAPVRKYLDLERLYQLARSDHTLPENDARRLVNGVALGCFLEWHALHIKKSV